MERDRHGQPQKTADPMNDELELDAAALLDMPSLDVGTS